MNDMTPPAPEAAIVEALTDTSVAEDQALDAAYDKAAAAGVEPEAGDEPVIADPVVADPVDEPVAPVVSEAPADLPLGIKEKWAGMSEDVREAVIASHRDLGRKLADQGRVSQSLQAVRPIYDVLARAAEELPSLKGMTPQHIAHDMLAMARIQNDLMSDPVRTILGVAQQYGAIDGIRAALTGQQAPAQKQVSPEQLRAVQNQVAQAADPKIIEQRVTQAIALRENERMVQDYAATKPLWSEAEASIPDMIAVAQKRLGDGASAKDILDAAYDMAIHADPVLRAKVQAAAKPLIPDPALTAAQRNAKSVNVQSQPGKAKALTEDQQYDAIWEKGQS